jgi:hypothetical protein
MWNIKDNIQHKPRVKKKGEKTRRTDKAGHLIMLACGWHILLADGY